MYDICAIGNALVDILVSVGDDFLAQHKVAKGAMTLVDDARATALLDGAGAAAALSSGGSAGNTIAGVASLGGRCAYLGKVGRDRFGDAFSGDLRRQGIHFPTATSPDLATGRCVVLVTSDAQRSMNTFLGAAVDFAPADIDTATVAAAAVTYLEGYLFDKPLAQDAFRTAARVAHAANRKLALTLSDSFCVLRHGEAFRDLVKNDVDILFANEDELKTLYGTRDLAAALQIATNQADIVVTTRGAQGAVIARADERHAVAAHPVAKVIDTTGAGDLYAAGFLFGVTQGKTLPECGRIGAVAAAEVISHFGPRPQATLHDLV